MPTVRELTDPYLSTYTRVPPAGLGVCEICHSAPNHGFPRCYSCKQTMEQVTRPVKLVVPISLTKIPASISDEGGQFHDVLRNYKYSHSPEVRTRLGLHVSAVLTRFLAGHGDCIATAAGAAWDFITVTPSSRGRVGPHPLEGALQMSPFLSNQYRSVLNPGPGIVKWNQARDDGYALTADVTGARILLVDDTFTTGAHTQSAASALRLAGAEVVAIVPIGRVVDPNFSDVAGELWKKARAAGFTFDHCCLE